MAVRVSPYMLNRLELVPRVPLGWLQQHFKTMEMDRRPGVGCTSLSTWGLGLLKKHSFPVRYLLQWEVAAQSSASQLRVRAIYIASISSVPCIEGFQCTDTFLVNLFSSILAETAVCQK